MSRVLLIGGSYSSLPLAQAILELGHDLILAGNRPDEPAHKMASQSVTVDYSSIPDFLQAVTPLEIDACVPSANDRAYRAGTILAERLRLTGYDAPETEQTLSLKARFRECCDSLGIPSPQTHTVDAAKRLLDLGHTLIVKPTDSFSGIGASLLTRSDELDGALKSASDASPTRAYVIEDFVQGTLHSHSMFWRSGGIAADFFVDEFCTQRQFQVNSSNHPSRLGQVIRDAVREMVIQLARHLELTDGLLHTQFIANEESVMLIESMRRCPGDLFPSLIERSTGFDYSRAYVGPFLGMTNVPLRKVSERSVARHTVNSLLDGHTWSIEFEGESQGWAVVPLTTSGSYLESDPNTKSGIVFVTYGNEQAMWRSTPRLVDNCTVAEGRMVRGGE